VRIGKQQHLLLDLPPSNGREDNYSVVDDDAAGPPLLLRGVEVSSGRLLTQQSRKQLRCSPGARVFEVPASIPGTGTAWICYPKY
jgi:hypothetical protein